MTHNPIWLPLTHGKFALVIFIWDSRSLIRIKTLHLPQEMILEGPWFLIHKVSKGYWWALGILVQNPRWLPPLTDVIRFWIIYLLMGVISLFIQWKQEKLLCSKQHAAYFVQNSRWSHTTYWYNITLNNMYTYNCSIIFIQFKAWKIYNT